MPLTVADVQKLRDIENELKVIGKEIDAGKYTANGLLQRMSQFNEKYADVWPLLLQIQKEYELIADKGGTRNTNDAEITRQAAQAHNVRVQYYSRLDSLESLIDSGKILELQMDLVETKKEYDALKEKAGQSKNPKEFAIQLWGLEQNLLQQSRHINQLVMQDNVGLQHIADNSKNNFQKDNARTILHIYNETSKPLEQMLQEKSENYLLKEQEMIRKALDEFGQLKSAGRNLEAVRLGEKLTNRIFNFEVDVTLLASDYMGINDQQPDKRSQDRVTQFREVSNSFKTKSEEVQDFVDAEKAKLDKQQAQRTALPKPPVVAAVKPTSPLSSSAPTSSGTRPLPLPDKTKPMLASTGRLQSPLPPPPVASIKKPAVAPASLPPPPLPPVVLTTGKRDALPPPPSSAAALSSQSGQTKANVTSPPSLGLPQPPVRANVTSPLPPSSRLVQPAGAAEHAAHNRTVYADAVTSQGRQSSKLLAEAAQEKLKQLKPGAKEAAAGVPPQSQKLSNTPQS